MLATTAGWVLSAVGQLNRAGYLIFTVVAALALWFFRRELELQSFFARWHWPAIRRRFSRAWPAWFLVLAALLFLGGLLYAPTNHTALTYRTPRVLHWLAEGNWFWIHTENYRMNNRACGIEWLTAPLLLFTKSDRALFLVNFIPFLLLPGMIFSAFTRLGVRGRVAWNWMWLLPTGYCFLLQAASLGNDTFPAVYALAMVDFGCRAWQTRRTVDLWYSILAAALLTGAKASNLPLLLPWAILILALLPLLLRKPVWSLLMLALAALVSFLPTAGLNIFFIGDWSGLNLERAGMDMKNPLVGLWGNAFILALNNFLPPFFPLAGWWNQSALTVLPGAIVQPLVANFEMGWHWLGELPTEDWVGIGLGVSVLMTIAGVKSLRCGFFEKTVPPRARSIPACWRKWVIITPWIALLAYCIKSGMVTPARLIAPYYPLLLLLLVTGPGQAEMVRRGWWRIIVWLTLLLSVPVIVLTPGRPLWPAVTVLTGLHEANPEKRAIERALRVYTVYANRADPLANVRALLPPGIDVVGFVGTEDDIDISLWRPFGERRVEHILLSDPLEYIQRRNVRYAAVGGFNLKFNDTTLEEWQQRTGAEVIAETTATLKVSEGPQPWYVVQFPE